MDALLTGGKFCHAGNWKTFCHAGNWENVLLASDWLGQTALHVAMERGSYIDWLDQTPLHDPMESVPPIGDYATDCALAILECAKKFDNGVKALLLEPNHEGHTPLHVAAFNGHIRIVREFLKVAKERAMLETMLCSRDKEQNTSLHAAAYGCNARVIGLLYNSLDHAFAEELLLSQNWCGQNFIHLVGEKDCFDAVMEMLRSNASLKEKLLGMRDAFDATPKTWSRLVDH